MVHNIVHATAKHNDTFTVKSTKVANSHPPVLCCSVDPFTPRNSRNCNLGNIDGDNSPLGWSSDYTKAPPKPISVPTPDGCVDKDARKDVHGSMMFADYIVLCGDDETDMTEYLETWRRALEDRRMKISRPKTQFIDFKFGQDNGQGREPVKILEE